MGTVILAERPAGTRFTNGHAQPAVDRLTRLETADGETLWSIQYRLCDGTAGNGEVFKTVEAAQEAWDATALPVSEPEPAANVRVEAVAAGLEHGELNAVVDHLAGHLVTVFTSMTLDRLTSGAQLALELASELERLAVFLEEQARREGNG
jgi:hypothetical protein